MNVKMDLSMLGSKFGKGLGRVTAAVLLASLVFGGCSNGQTEEPSAAASTNASAGATAEPKEIVELKAFFPGDNPVGFDAVMDAVNEKLKNDNIGASLQILFVPWADYANLTNVKVAAGEEFDMFLDAPWQHINQMIASGGIIALDELVAKQPELQAAIAPAMWEGNRFGGKIMGIPLGTTQPSGLSGFIIRQDLREKYGLAPLKTLADVEKFLYLVKEKDPDIIPYINDGRYGTNELSYFSETQYSAEDSGSLALTENQLTVFYYVGPDKKVHPITDSPEFMEGARNTTKLYKDGIIAKNIAQEENAVLIFNQGKAAATAFTPNGAQGMKFIDALKVPGVKLEIVVPIDEGQKIQSSLKQGNFLVIPKSSKHPEKVIEVMNWLSIQENHDLLEYGIPGVDWEPVGDSSIHQLSKYAFPGYVMTWRPTLHRTPDIMLPDDRKWFEFAADADNFIPSLTVGFTADLTPVKTEIAKMDPLLDSVIRPMGNGVLDADKGMKLLKEGMEQAGSDLVLAELQKQYDAFLAAQQ